MKTAILNAVTPLYGAQSKAIINPSVGSPLFMDVLKEYSDREIRENSLSPVTAQKYTYYAMGIRKYLESMGLQNMTIDQVRIKTMEQMRYWLQTHLKQCSLGHASRHVELCKRVMDYALMMEYTLINPLSALRAKRDKVKEVVHLEKHELDLLMNFDVSKIKDVPGYENPTRRPHQDGIQKVIDLYTFQCYTGLSYADLYTYSVIEKDGRLWIANRREKNDTPYYVPLFPQAKAIHEKYNGKLPYYCNQPYNRKIKQVAKMIGIKKHLTTHTARKTFATHRDNEGWSTKTIADMMGNTLEVLQKHYLAKSTKRIENELVSLGL